ncbi:hypothetical protein BpHYR1_038721 [Brachionus plicatilis]|uniref:Uncharacterized protein n=1 Tax=Brachionus plicatilis TaxID=10195 RepID=A0A3M7S9X1_BRAPC|nr:hypothetical protein BpHYR1_038721 [Brachionus plicatilis]
MSVVGELSSSKDNSNHVILKQLEGNSDCFNDVIIIKCTQSKAKYNLIYFGGDIQNYEDEMNKSSTCKSFTKWNLLTTGYLLEKKFSSSPETAANILIIRPDFFHLKCFANYSNFVTCTDFGIPITISNAWDSKLDQSELNSMPVQADAGTNKTSCIDHVKKLLFKSLSEYNSSTKKDQIDDKLPIILCGFSKGCVVLNQFCTELCPSIRPSTDYESVHEFLTQIKHIFWLDGGHSGTENSWIKSEEIVQSIKQFKWSCYVFVTPYQLKSQKLMAVQEYHTFIELLKKNDDKENEDYDTNWTLNSNKFLNEIKIIPTWYNIDCCIKY